MLSIHPHFIVNRQGCKISVVLSMPEWNAILDELEQLEDMREFDLESADIDDISQCRFHTVCVRKK